MTRVAILAVLAAALAGCGGASWGDPYIIAPGMAARGGGPVDISVCYNAMLTTAERLRAMVAENCTEPRLLANERDLDVCSLSQPVHALYRCAAVSSRLANQRQPMPLTKLR